MPQKSQKSPPALNWAAAIVRVLSIADSDSWIENRRAIDFGAKDSMATTASLPQVRPARAGDAEGIAALIDPFVQAGKLLPRTATEVRDLIPTGFVAELDEKLVGFAALEIYSSKLAEIRSLAVAEDQRGLGLGSKLVAACVDLAGKRNILEVMVVTSSEEFFRTCGFDFTLPGEKKALFIQPVSSAARASSKEGSPS